MPWHLYMAEELFIRQDATVHTRTPQMENNIETLEIFTEFLWAHANYSKVPEAHCPEC